jgi:hypothetical protein
MGCGETLFVGSGGYVTCSFIGCPKPDAASDILGESETDHIVEFTDLGWTIQHPLRDRVEGALFTCPATMACQMLDGPPVAAGRYRMVRVPDVAATEPTWRWVKL